MVRRTGDYAMNCRMSDTGVIRNLERVWILFSVKPPFAVFLPDITEFLKWI
jgi:hypothetical protein